MGGEKIELVKKSLAFMVEQLKPSDRMAIVGFDSNVHKDLKLTLLNKEGKKAAQTVISKLRAGTSTNLSGGLFEAFDVVKNRSAYVPLIPVPLNFCATNVCNCVVNNVCEWLYLNMLCTIFMHVQIVQQKLYDIDQWAKFARFCSSLMDLQMLVLPQQHRLYQR